MESVLDLSLKDAARLATNQKLILQGVGWDFYERILKEYEESNALHFAYDDGFLEVEVPLLKHERPTEILRDLITNICIEKDLDMLNAGKTTFRKKTEAKGVEADSAFYIKNEFRVRGLLDLDLSKDPPPDLVIEVDITSPSLNKMPIYAALGVSEVWLYTGVEVEFFKLVGSDYVPTEFSFAFPFLTRETATGFLRKGLTETYNRWIKEVRQWAQEA
jgi:Uma2 family endonuclease